MKTGWQVNGYRMLLEKTRIHIFRPADQQQWSWMVVTTETPIRVVAESRTGSAAKAKRESEAAAQKWWDNQK